MQFDVGAYNRPGIRQAWRGPSLLVLDDRGRAGSGPGPLTGFFHRETRYLSALRLTVQGEEPVPCSVAEVEPDRMELSLLYPPVETQGGGGGGSGGDRRHRGILSRGLDLDLRFRTLPASMEVTLAATSRWDERVELALAWEVGADFAGLFEAITGERRQEAEVTAEALEDGGRFRYLHPELPLETRVTAVGASWRYAGGELRIVRQAPVVVLGVGALLLSGKSTAAATVQQ